MIATSFSSTANGASPGWRASLPDPAGGAVLDLACGRGRRSHLLAGRGHPVCAVDRDAEVLAGLADVAGIAPLAADLEGPPDAPWPLAGRLRRHRRHSLPAPPPPAGPGSPARYPRGAHLRDLHGRQRALRRSLPAPTSCSSPRNCAGAQSQGWRVVAYEEGEVGGAQDVQGQRPAMLQRLCAVADDLPVRLARRSQSQSREQEQEQVATSRQSRRRILPAAVPGAPARRPTWGRAASLGQPVRRRECPGFGFTPGQTTITGLARRACRLRFPMPYLIFITFVWALSFNLIGEFIAGRVDSDFAVLTRVVLAGAAFLPFTRWRGAPAPLLWGTVAAGALQFGVTYLCLYRSYGYLTVPEVLLFTIFTPVSDPARRSAGAALQPLGQRGRPGGGGWGADHPLRQPERPLPHRLLPVATGQPDLCRRPEVGLPPGLRTKNNSQV